MIRGIPDNIISFWKCLVRGESSLYVRTVLTHLSPKSLIRAPLQFCSYYNACRYIIWGPAFLYGEEIHWGHHCMTASVKQTHISFSYNTKSNNQKERHKQKDPSECGGTRGTVVLFWNLNPHLKCITFQAVNVHFVIYLTVLLVTSKKLHDASEVPTSFEVRTMCERCSTYFKHQALLFGSNCHANDKRDERKIGPTFV